MKRPYLDQYERMCVRAGTLYGDLALLDLRMQQAGREITRQLRINRALDGLARMLSK